MNFIKTAVQRPISVIMLFLCIVLLGAVSFKSIGLDLMPDMDIPVSLVMTSYDGAGSEEVETMVTAPMETALATVHGITDITSISSTGSSIVVASFDWGTDLDFANLEMREKIDLVTPYLPDDVGDPTIMKIDLNSMPIIIMGISGGSSLTELKQIVEEDIQPVIERQDGVASATVSGGYDQEVNVTVDPTVLENYGLTMSGIAQYIQMNNYNMAAGSVSDGSEDLTIRVVGQFSSLSDIENISIILNTGATVLLKDIATVSLDLVQNSGDVYQNGEPAVYMSISKQSDANTVNSVDAVMAAIADLESSLPDNVTMEVIMNQGDMIQMTIDSLMDSLVIGCVLAIVILFLFLRSIRSTLVIAISIPISLISTCVLMYFNDMTLNMMTLGGLALGAGMMVDSSIVILENIQRMRTNGLGAKEAAIKGASQLVLAVITSTITTVAVFLPITFTSGLVSIIFTDLALVVTFAMISSLVVAVILVPMLCSLLLRPEASYDSSKKGFVGVIGKGQNAFITGFEKLQDRYGKALAWCLGHRKSVFSFVLVVIICSYGLLAVIGKEFISSSESGQITISVELANSATTEETYAVVDKVLVKLDEIAGDDIANSLSLIGGSSSMLSTAISENIATVTVDTVDLDDREMSITEICTELRASVKDIAGAEITIEAGDMMNMGTISSSSSASLTISGDDLDMLKELGDEVAAIMASIPGAVDATSSFEEGLPELHVTVDYSRATAMGLSVASVASYISSYVDGTFASTLSTDDGTEIDINVVVPESNSQNISSILNQKIPNATGGYALLGDVVTVTEGTGPVSIYRDNQTRYVTVSCSLSGVDLSSFTETLNQKLDSELVLPQGYTLEQGGSYEEMVEAFVQLSGAILLGVVLIYMVMAALFESFVQPFIILFSIPTAFVGVFFGLFITGNTLNVTSMIGIVMLMGIVVNNGIILIDCINDLRRNEGMAAKEAILAAGPLRLRPVLMTALTTILAMLPMAFSTAEGAELSSGMAVAIAFGLTTSTFLTLLFVPVVYSVVDNAGLKGRIKRAKKRAEKLEQKLAADPNYVPTEDDLKDQHLTDANFDISTYVECDVEVNLEDVLEKDAHEYEVQGVKSKKFKLGKKDKKDKK